MKVSPFWSQEQLRQHIRAAEELYSIKDVVIEYIRSHGNITERNVQELIIDEFDKRNLILHSHRPIVAFNGSGADPHYTPGLDSMVLKPETVVMLDIWAARSIQGAPYADITWMAYYGSYPTSELMRAYNAVITARDRAIDYMKSELSSKRMPVGKVVHELTNAYLASLGYEHHILHSTGHSIGFTSPHGRYGHIRTRNKHQLFTDLGYTIEPGLYFPGEYGIRSEINFYITKKYELVITTEPQHALTMI